MTTSSTQRSLKLLRERGYMAAVTEHWNPHARLRQDLFGFVDIVAVSRLYGIIAVQTTSGANMAARIDKIRESVHAKVWLDADGTILVHGWRKVGARGARKLWECREVRLAWNGTEIVEVEG